ncbi:Ca2+-binding protein, EF-hand superfamily [Palleronia marisminoris]|uniref:EF hand n=1 Tax=Palleronia marisminoris TaxID=315423 RepID=A0A1Y5SZL7_9RHOB|nr:EF-hand domain-containing protein [Palleronia marisminoris]SFH09635.1 Ca2+-binding protein, EF-hand superfamily [Palleronia marisminoris]SLN52602.1 EF hand [Palleronia marisminoris]
MIRTAIFALMAGTVMAGATFAQNASATNQGTQRPHPILRLDQNDDGQISREEMQAMGQNPMARADANGDGTVSRDEVISAAVERATERAGAMFDRFDEDNNGEIAVVNLPQPRGAHGDRAEQLFDRFDADGDGTLSAEEISQIPPMGRRGHHGPDGQMDHYRG